MPWLEVSLKDVSKEAGQEVRIRSLRSVPSIGLEVVRLSGSAEAIRSYLVTKFEDRIVEMHMNALKEFEPPDDEVQDVEAAQDG